MHEKLGMWLPWKALEVCRNLEKEKEKKKRERIINANMRSLRGYVQISPKKIIKIT